MDSSDPYDTDEDTKIQQIISQAQDSITLQQISKINSSSFTHTHLPTHLESRFQKLKTFPPNHTTQQPYLAKNQTFSTSNSSNNNNVVPGTTHQESFNLSPSKHIKNQNSDSGSVSNPSISLHEKKGMKTKSKSKPKNGSFSPSDSSHTSEESSMSSLFMPLKVQKEEGKLKYSKEKSLSPSPSSSPPRMWGCFWCSPKKEKKKSKEIDVGVGWEEYTSDELLSGIGSLSSKKQLKKIDKALKEEQKKINREAEKIVEWAKHVSGRMNFSDLEDELSDN